ncbi:PREDICTED: chymotrypsin-1-like [Polistes dominula]|uniref:Chymotrypsin-1-like n=1 Tax=Polistes dominula TaxID=743375 RepID=A0ABM1J178_POLDO|nr:PREDICTED: chymotrypsin-1-like [Polistes dominula]
MHILRFSLETCISANINVENRPFSAIPLSSRVIGGKDADDNAFPYHVSIRLYGFHICGGSIITDQWILTAAHCLNTRNIRNTFVVAGSNSVLSGGIAYDVKEMIVHSEYQIGPILNDIGLLKIVGRFKYSNAIRPIRLPDEDIDETDRTAIFTGWGDTTRTGGSTNWMQLISLKIVEFSKCKMIYPSITRANICTDNSYTYGVCYGDSGSPLVLDGVQIGLASWVTPCAKGFPDVHTKIYSYIDWIKSHIS